MAKKDRNQSCCLPTDISAGCCKVKAVINIDDRGQMVLPEVSK